MIRITKNCKTVAITILYSLSLLFIISENTNAQSVGIGASSFTPSANSMLEVQSNTKGVLIPRMTDGERMAIVPTYGGDFGLLVYQTNTVSATNAAGYWYWDGTDWISIGDNRNWKLEGNEGTNPNLNFIGTADANDFVMRTDNVERARIAASGNFGIGTVSPTSTLHVEADGAAGPIVRVHSITDNPSTVSFTTPYKSYRIGQNKPIANPGLLDGFYIDDIGANATRLYITSPGNVGIGTVSPTQKLSVSAGMNVDNDNINSGSLTNALLFGAGGTEGIGSNRTLWWNNMNGLDFYTASANRMSITNGGYVGIGTVSPWQMLTVGAGISVDYNDGNSGSLANGLMFGTYGTGEGIASKRTAGGNQWGLDFYQAGVNRMRIWNNGQVCVGQNSGASLVPEADLTVLNASTGSTVDVPVFTARHSGAAGTTWRMGSVEFYTEGLSNIGFTNQLCPLNGDGSANLGSTAVSKYSGYRWATLYCVNAPNVSSDTTLKENIEPVAYGLNQIRKINPISYKLKKDFGGTDKELSSEDKRTHIGFNAQELKQVLPEVVSSWDYVSDNEKGYKKVKTKTLGVYYDEVIPVVVNAVKDLDKQQQSIIENINISDFGTEQRSGAEIKITFNNDFAKKLQGKPVVTVTSTQPEVTLYVTDVTDKGFTVKSNSKNTIEVSFNWIAMSKINIDKFAINSAYTDKVHAEKLKAIAAFETALPAADNSTIK